MRVGIFLCSVMLASCSHLSGSALLPGNLPQSIASARQPQPDAAYASLYSFKGGLDGRRPAAGLISPVTGALYGTTYEGGSKTGSCAGFGCGTVFAITTSGDERVLHRFRGSTDGAGPLADLIEVNGTLYGTTENGGRQCSGGAGCGTIFEMSLTGKERVIHAFGQSRDGFYPQAGLLAIGDTLYGTTAGGNGTVFKASTSGHERVLYRFGGYPNDGADPLGNLIFENGNFYGTASSGGNQNVGIIFKVSSSGNETVLHNFNFTHDGGYPLAGLTSLNGTLYGTASAGGANKRGTVFTVSANGGLHVLHSFKGFPKADGSYPYATLIAYKGELYGTTRGGGTHGDGVVFAVSPSGQERVVYDFTVAPDGTHPYARLVLLNGLFYGTTYFGGTSGDGTVFRLRP